MIEAGRMILDGNIDPLQLGAFLCVLRVRTEDPGEAAGFVRVIKERIVIPENAPRVELDWSSYAGKKRQLPWFLLSALLLAESGITVFMHGTEGHTPDRIYARETLKLLNVPIATTMAEAAEHMLARNFAYLPLADLSPRLQEIMDLKSVLGVRSPMNTFTRMVNPFDAPFSIQSIFHPNYGEIHRDTALLLKQPHMAVFKGEGGEVERRPEKPVVVESLHDGEKTDEKWPPLLPGVRVPIDEEMDMGRLMRLWRGEIEDEAAVMAVVGTAAIALRLMGRADDPEDAIVQASAMWDNRPSSPLRLDSAA